MNNFWTTEYHMPVTLDEEERMVEFDWVKCRLLPKLREFWQLAYNVGSINRQEHRAILGVIEHQANRPGELQDIF